MSADAILFEQKGDIALVTFNRPEVHNAFNQEMEEGLSRAIDSIEGNPEIKALILTGAGSKSFVSGSDITGLSKRTPLTGIEASVRRQGLLNRIEDLHVPSIAAVNGYAFGIGCEVALACTFRLASEKAKMGQLEINLGIIPGAGGTQRLPRLIGKARAAELILTGKVIGAEEAYQLGLLNRVVPDQELLEACMELARTLSEKSPVAMKYGLRAINEGMKTDLQSGLKIEGLCLGACFASEDSKEGLNAFLEKRKPVFKGL